MNKRQAIELCRIGQGITYNPALMDGKGDPICQWTGRGELAGDDAGWFVRYHPAGPGGELREWEHVEEALTYMCGIGMHECDARREAWERVHGLLEESTDG